MEIRHYSCATGIDTRYGGYFYGNPGTQKYVRQSRLDTTNFFYSIDGIIYPI